MTQILVSVNTLGLEMNRQVLGAEYQIPKPSPLNSTSLLQDPRSCKTGRILLNLLVFHLEVLKKPPRIDHSCSGADSFVVVYIQI